MAITRQISITDEAFQSLSKLKGDLSWSKMLIQLEKEHHELSKLKLEQERSWMKEEK